MSKALKSLSNAARIEIANVAVERVFDDIWVPRCNTANTSAISGIKWKSNEQRRKSKTSKPKKSQPDVNTLSLRSQFIFLVSEKVKTLNNFPSLASIVNNTCKLSRNTS